MEMTGWNQERQIMGKELLGKFDTFKKKKKNLHAL